MIPRLRAILCSDAPSAWRQAGFSLDARNQINLGPVKVKFTGAENEEKKAKGFISWVWSGLPDSIREIDGVPTIITDESMVDTSTAVHPNGTSHIDHVVLRTGDISRTKSAFDKIGVQLRREREDIYPGITQLFYRPADEIIIEVIGPTVSKDAGDKTPVSSETSDSFLWGATFSVNDDLSTIKGMLGDDLSEIRKAKQPGRKIATLRNKNLNINAAVAFMTKHQKPSSL